MDDILDDTAARRSRALLAPAALLTTLLAVGCGAGEPAGADAPALGPVDGHDLPGVDLDRIQVGEPAPDFTLTSYDGPPVTLSDFRGSQDVLLVFYRGHW